MPRARIFVDFWNLQISLKSVRNDKYAVDYKKFPVWLTQKASELVGEKLDFDGMKVYISYNPGSDGDRKLLNWANNKLAFLPGVNISIHERKPKGPPVCQNCHNKITKCIHCEAELHRTIEKGVDTSIVTDLLGLAWEKAWDIAILVSEDRDYVPAVNLLSTKGYRVVNAHIPPPGRELVKACWGNINLDSNALSDFEYVKTI